MAAQMNRSRLTPDDIAEWPALVEEVMASNDAETYRRRKLAIVLYVDGTSLAEIEERTSVQRKELYEFIDRCLHPAADGRPMGFRALGRYVRLGGSTNVHLLNATTAVPRPGLLETLFTKIPAIRELAYNLAVFGKRTRGQAKNRYLPHAAIHKALIEVCKEHGLTKSNYPLNNRSEGRKALRKWVTKARAQAVGTTTVNWAQTLESLPQPITRAFKRLEFDGHVVDYRCTIEMPSPSGVGTVDVDVSRFMIVAAVEVASRDPVAYTIVYNSRNYKASDLVRTLNNSLTPWKAIGPDIPGLPRKAEEVLPSALSERLQFACADEIYFDNDLAQLSEEALSYIERTIRSVPVFGAVQEKDSRPFIEGFWKLLEEAGIHQAAGTTGSSPSDPRRALKGPRLSLPLFESLIERLICAICASKAPDCSQSRNDLLVKAANDGRTIIRRVPASARRDLMRYDVFAEVKIVLHNGKVVVRLLGAEYTSDVLRRATGLVGRAAVAMTRSDDPRTCELVLRSGTSLGVVFVERRWRATKHSITTRKEILRVRNEGVKFHGHDIVAQHTQLMEKGAKTSKAKALALARLRKEQETREADLLEDRELDTSHTSKGAPPLPLDMEARLADIGAL